MEYTTSYGAFEAKTHFSSLLDKVEHQGARIAITRHGKIIAHIVPAQTEQGARDQMLEEVRVRALRAKPLGEISAKELIEDGRRI